ncbi:hypothetical protein Y032_0003g1286 [Ancylostoma ceylanicum]|nr:hypothetical protein Y032_0003g1286 [Ancylostoma ceylanicum]
MRKEQCSETKRGNANAGKQPPRCVRRSNERNGFRTTLGLSGVLPRRFIEYGLNDLHEKLEIIQNPKGDLTLLRTDSVIRLTPVS